MCFRSCFGFKLSHSPLCPSSPLIMVVASKAAPKKMRIITPADESLGHLGNANMQAARKKLNDLLDQNPQNVWQMVEMLQNGTINKICDAKMRDVGKTHWHGTQVRFQVIPKYWMEAYMLDINPNLESHLDDIKNSSKTAIRELFYASHMVSGSTLIPAVSHEKVIFTKMLRARHAQCGSRLDKAHLWPKTAGFEWTHLPIFQAKVKEGLIAVITHISGATYTIPEKQNVPAGGEWLNLWSDTEAVYKSGVVTLFMKDIFDLSSLDPQQCLHQLTPASDSQEGQEPTTPAKTGSPSNAAASSPEKVAISTPFNPDLLPVRPNRNKKANIKKVKGFGPSSNKDRVVVPAKAAK
jgi:hypothetical protein